jgi:hypothetical protein
MAGIDGCGADDVDDQAATMGRLRMTPLPIIGLVWHD